MSGTPFTSVYDLFMQLQNDYRLVALYQASETNFNIYLESWLLFAINKFSVCNQSLAFSSQTFTETLTQENILMLAQLMVEFWLLKEINDITQMNLHVQDNDFKTFAESQNLKEKRDLLNVTRENLSQLLIDYSYKNNDWANWGQSL